MSLTQYVNESTNDVFSLKQKLIDLINSDTLDGDDLMKMINIGKYSDRVLGYKAADPNHKIVIKKQVNGNQVYRYTLKNKKTGEEVINITSGNPLGNKSANVWGVIKQEEETFEKLDPLFNENPLKDRLSNIDVSDAVQKSLIRLLRDMNMIDRYFNYIERPSITSLDFINGSNIFSVCKPLGFNSKAFHEIATFTAKDNRGTNLGNYEILLKLVLSDYKNTTRLNGKGGDIIAGDFAIEIKGKGGRLAGQNSGSVKDINNTFRRFFNDLDLQDKVFKNPFANLTSVGTAISILINKHYDNRVIAKAVAEAIKSYYSDVTPGFEEFILRHWSDVEKDPKIVHRMIGCAMLIEYQKDENWDYIAVFKEDPINGDYKIISKDELNFESIYNMKEITFDKGMQENSVRDKAVGIIYKK